MRYAQALSINGLHCELIGANQLNSRDVSLEGCSGSVNGYSTYMNDSLTARYGIYCVNCPGVTINGANLNSAAGYSLQNLVYFDSNCLNCLALGLSKALNTGATDPFGGWVSHNGQGGGVFSQLGVFPTTGGTYNGNWFFSYNDRYAGLYGRSGTTNKGYFQIDVSNGNPYIGGAGPCRFRDMSGNTKALIDLTKGVFNLTPLTVAPSSPSTGDIAYADGSGWNPGSGAGLYCYDGAAWHKLW